MLKGVEEFALQLLAGTVKGIPGGGTYRCKCLGMGKSPQVALWPPARLHCGGDGRRGEGGERGRVLKVGHDKPRRGGVFVRESSVDFELGSGQTSYCCPEEILFGGSGDFQGRYFCVYPRAWLSQMAGTL